MILLHLIVLACSAPDDTLPFSSGELAVRGGVLLPAGSLYRLFDPVAQGGASLSMAHWGTVLTRLDIAYARMDGVEPMHYVLCAAGYDWRPGRAPLELGASLGVFYVRNGASADTAWLSKDGETEFGLCLRAATPVWRGARWTLRAEAQLQQAFTNPDPSLFAWLGASVSWRAW